VLLNQPYTTKNDIWALGLIYYEMLFGKTPWDVKSMADLTNMPRTVPVKFPFNISISKMSKNFILGCLQYEESNRLSWPDIFKSDIFTQTTSFNPAHSEVLHFSKEAQYILAKCQNIVVKNKLDIKVMFQKLDKSHDNQLDSHELSVLLKNVESTFTHEHCLEII
jgi:serine/threonine protein kinase